MSKEPIDFKPKNTGDLEPQVEGYYKELGKQVLRLVDPNDVGERVGGADLPTNPSSHYPDHRRLGDGFYDF